MNSMEARRYLAIYLNDHLAGAAGGVARAHALARAHRGRPDEGRLRRLAGEIAADRGALLAVMMSLGLPIRRYKSLAVAAAEKAGRLKLNGRLKNRSPLSDLEELEVLRLGVEAKAAGWRTLLALADREPGLRTPELQRLLARAQAQIAALDELHKEAIDPIFSRRMTTRTPTIVR
ncbi:hypothetical protein [Actinomadura rugatobispora]|uniref:DUF892 family protein n=1 Tax=Actinomadura rugatobispora TaxID=1994 RepID=A0ABW1A166_9ACTN